MNQATRARRAGSSFRSVVAMWNHRVASTPDATAWLRREASGVWTPRTWREADRRARQIAGGWLSRGLERTERIGILAETSVEWILADLGILMAGGATTTVFPRETPDRIASILADSAVRYLVCDDDAAVDRILPLRDRLPSLRAIVVIEGRARPDDDVVTLDTIEAEGATWNTEHPEALSELALSIGPDDLASILYTSGTMGEPRGVELTHDAWVYEAEAIDQLGVVGPTDVQLLFLPLAHVFAKVMQVASIRLGVPTAVDGRVDRLDRHLVEVRPTWVAGVPRVYERILDRVRESADARGFLARTALDRAIDLGADVRERQRRGERVGIRRTAALALADRTILRRIRERFGGRLRFLVSGGAPLPVQVARFFDAAGITICEGYGLTESSAASFVNTPDAVKLGTVGRAVPGTEVRIADDGEVLIRSRGVMRAYHGLPEATAEVLDEEGWLHTGDIGVLLPSGHLRITDRKKAILVLANGKKVAPSPIEQRLTSASPLIAHAIVVGDRRPWCAVILSLDEEAVQAWADREGVALPTDPLERSRAPELLEALDQTVEDVDRELAGYEQLRRVLVAPEPFTVDNGLLTPSLKVRRRAVESRYADRLDALWGSPLPR